MATKVGAKVRIMTHLLFSATIKVEFKTRKVHSVEQ